jgi:integrase
VKNILEGAKRKLATPTVKKEPITPELLSLMYNSNYKENDLFSQRTICACLLAYAGFLRVSELLQIRRNDIIFEATYICIFIPNSKTDIYRNDNSVVIVRTDSDLCPVKNLELYLVWGNILKVINLILYNPKFLETESLSGNESLT